MSPAGVDAPGAAGLGLRVTQGARLLPPGLSAPPGPVAVVSLSAAEHPDHRIGGESQRGGGENSLSACVRRDAGICRGHSPPSEFGCNDDRRAAQRVGV